MPRYFVRKLTTVAIFALLLKPIVHDHLRGNFWSLEKTLKFNPIYHLSAKMITRILSGSCLAAKTSYFKTKPRKLLVMSQFDSIFENFDLNRNLID